MKVTMPRILLEAVNLFVDKYFVTKSLKLFAGQVFLSSGISFLAQTFQIVLKIFFSFISVTYLALYA